MVEKWKLSYLAQIPKITYENWNEHREVVPWLEANEICS